MQESRVSLSVYNTLTNKKEKFVPIEPGKVKLYLCGPTVYGLLHIGNFRGPITFNLMRNWMEESGMEVNFVYNYTDIDDKIINKAIDEGVEASVISERYIAEFEKDFKRLGLTKHTHNPRVSEHMEPIIEIVQGLLDKGKAYEIDGEVFFEIKTFPDYGKLSKNKLEDLQAGQRVEVDEKKRHPGDFVLWKPSKVGEPSWDSPWGKGRPGWHIECSAMIKSLLGETIDIHGGGIDLIFPHHECEIAQAEAINKKSPVNYWLHANMLTLNGKKMAKSTGNNILPDEMFSGKNEIFSKPFSPAVTRFFLLQAHYRSIVDLSEDALLASEKGFQRLTDGMEVLHKLEGTAATSDFDITAWEKKCYAAMNDDFNSPLLIAQLFDAVKFINAVNNQTETISTADLSQLQAKMTVFINDVLGLILHQEETDNKINTALEGSVNLLIDIRKKARDNKDFATSDAIRDQLLALGVQLKDGKDGTTFSV